MTMIILQLAPSAIQREIDARVEKSSHHIVSKDQELAEQKRELRVAESIQKDITNDLSAIKEGIGHTGNTAQQLRKKKEELEKKLKTKEKLEKKLKTKEQEMIAITAIKQEQALEDKTALTKDEIAELIQEKEEEIAEHKVELEEVESKLREAETQMSEYEKQLHQFSSELTELFGKLKSLREANAETKQELDLEREKVDLFCMQQTATKKSEDLYRKEPKVKIIVKLIMYYYFDSYVLFNTEAH